ncbi:Holliday junction branch migration DNA helicase RuvB [bacterium]|nr:Holliday junction branch migration DNA helicase RuvB [bacterium]
MPDDGPRMMNLSALRGDAEFNSLRPTRFADFAGQRQVVDNLSVMIDAARIRQEPVEHILFSGPPGLGKTTLAHLIANEMETTLVASSGPLMDKPGDLVAILSSLGSGQVFFLDEIHRLPRTVEETLYSAMEDYKVDIVTGSGPGARTITLPLERFTLVGATTRSGMLSAPLRDRFGGQFHLEFYTPEELAAIVSRATAGMDLEIDDDARLFLAAHSRGTPRIALRLLRRVRDFVQVSGEVRITAARAREALERIGIGKLGLDRMDREILAAIIQRFGGGPVGLETLSAVFHEEKDVLAEVHEPYMLKLGLLARTPRGRVATARAYEYLGLAVPQDLPEAPLFDDAGDGPA